MARISPRRQIAYWLVGACAMVFVVLLVGGITRLTQSGLSITDWKPVRGLLPPLSQEDWHRVFEAYRDSPEYRVLNRGMSLEEFQNIFWWEYAHRVAARLFVAILAVPMLYFALRGWLRGADLGRAAGLLVLTAAQGLLGWSMVQTGLIDDPYVDHLYLAGHLGVAMTLFASMWWWALQILGEKNGSSQRQSSPLLGRAAGAFTILVFFQSIWGAFVAGLDAGRIVTTFPKMGDYWISPLVGDQAPIWVDLTTNPVSVQFIHRTGGISLLVLALVLWWISRNASVRIARAFTVLTGITLIQSLLGIATLVSGVPIVLGAVHQAVGLTLFATAIWVTSRSVDR